MSSDKKYLKYKIKYLNLKALIHNQRLNSSQHGGSREINNLTEESDGLPTHLETITPTENSVTSNTFNGLPEQLSDSPASEQVSEHSTNVKAFQVGGTRKIRKESELSDSEISTTESSLLSFSSVESSQSSDSY
uniref:Uncharacterized protein n=1 Tax=viral metagenome TaxID=1070528 RepID=A0A6C0DAA4_9ZZZZ